MKAGYMDGAAISEGDVKKLADLETREVLLAKTAGVLKASLFKAACTFNTLPSKAVRLVDALRQKQESN
jgi:large subunit ribosomal protein L10